MQRITIVIPARCLASLLCAGLLFAPTGAFAQGGDEDEPDEDADTEEEEILDEEAAPDEEEAMDEEAVEEEYYNDGISTEWEGGFDFEAIPEDTFIWSYRGEGDSLMAFAVDVLNDTVDPEFELHDWDVTGGADEEDDYSAPTADEIQARLNDEEFSPLRQVLADGPIEGEEVSLMVLVPDSALAEARATQSIPNVAILKAVTMADQLTNGLKFSYIKRQDYVQFTPGAQSGVPQLQFEDAKVFEGVVQFHFNLGMPTTTFGSKRRGEGYSARADIPSESIADGYDRARDEAMRLAVRKAIGEAARGKNQALPETVSGTVDFWEVLNEGYADGNFTVELRAWITVDALGAPSTAPLTTPGPIIINGEPQDSGATGY